MNTTSKDAAPKQNAALTGASRAFNKDSKPPVKPKPNINTYSGTNGALAAARKASPSRNASLSRPDLSGVGRRLSYQRSGSSIGSENDLEHQAFLQRRMGTGTGHLQPPPTTRDNSRSPSFIAATLAASRSVPASPQHTGQQQLSPAAAVAHANHARQSSASVRSLSSSRGSPDPLDTTSTPPTTSLISIFERNTEPTQAVKTKAPVKPARKPSPSPPRPPRHPRTPSPPAARSPKPEAQTPQPVSAQSFMGKSPGSTTPKPKTKPIPKPKPIPQRNSLPEIKTSPIPIPPKLKPKPTVVQSSIGSDSSNDSFVSASDYQPSIHALYNRRNSRAQTPTVTSSPNFYQKEVDTLANAIVASSLASSRAASPAKHNTGPSLLYPPAPPPTRRHLFHSKEVSRTPSPQKVSMRTTMRKSPKPEEEDDAEKRRARRHFVKKHPNKHNEGDRKRWRDQITARERKRYEAVWASNKGLFPTAPGSESSVCSLVVRDIWSRSRLHQDVLEEVYSLVDRKENGRLERDEFVVGLWLIDQRLKGRKLPIRVTDSVWRSVGQLGGIKVKNRKH